MMNNVNKMMKDIRRRKVRGFTLIELIVVIAIVSVLSAILVSGLTKYIEKAQKRADVENARMIYEAVNFIVATENVDDNFYIPKNGFTVETTVNDGYTKENGYERYRVYTVARMYGSTDIKHKNQDWGWTGTESNKSRDKFVDLLNNFEGFENYKHNKMCEGKVFIKMSCHKHRQTKKLLDPGSGKPDGSITDKWLICVRSDTNAIEIWAGNSQGRGANGPMYRLWPNPDNEYITD